jgi:hypothetical protein
MAAPYFQLQCSCNWQHCASSYHSATSWRRHHREQHTPRGSRPSESGHTVTITKVFPDALLVNAGSIWQFEPVSRRAKTWVKDNVHTESWQWLGARLSVDHRYGENLLQGLVGEGFEVRYL